MFRVRLLAQHQTTHTQQPQRSQHCTSTSCSWCNGAYSTPPRQLLVMETQASDHAHTVPKYSPTSALCKHLPAVLWRKFSSHKVSVQLHFKLHQCQCTPLTSDVHRVTQNLAGKGSGRGKEAASTCTSAPPRRSGGTDEKDMLYCKTAVLFSSLHKHEAR